MAHQSSHPRVVAAAWEPERPGARDSRDIKDAIVEPDWGGARVAAALTAADAALFAHGTEVAASEELVQALVDAFRAVEAVVIGHLTPEAFRTGEGAYPAAPPVERPLLRLPRVFHSSVKDEPFVIARDHEAARELLEPTVIAAVQSGERHAFVATDLLALDGESLDDVPLLERKRLLDTILEASELIRMSPFVKPSARTTLVTWATLGFGMLSWRGVNARYLAGRDNPQWAVGRAPASSQSGSGPKVPYGP